jgi:hypothetical protein
MGDDKPDNSAKEGVQIYILPCKLHVGRPSLWRTVLTWAQKRKISNLPTNSPNLPTYLLESFDQQ